MKRWYQAYQCRQPIVYLDETGFAPSTYRHWGWAAKGQQVFGYRNGQQRPRTSLIGAYLNNRLYAPLLFEGTCNSEVFNQWLEHSLLPELPPHALIVLDNATFHRSVRTRELVARAGHQILFLPPYSPHLNPIEKLWANIKRAWQQRPNLDIYSFLNASRYLWD